MKYTPLFLITSLLIAPVAMGAEFYSGENLSLSDDTAKTGNVYISGGTLTVKSPITGDLFAAGGNVNITSPVSDDLFVAGGDVTIESDVQGDLRVAGGKVTVSGNVDGDLMVAGGEVTIGPDASLHDVWIGAGQITIDNGATIAGDLHYSSGQEAAIGSGAKIEGTITKNISHKSAEDGVKGVLAAIAGGSVVWLFANLILLLLFAYGVPNKALALARDTKTSFGKNILWGLAVFIFGPIAMLVCFFSLIGIPVGVALIFLYIIAMYLAKIVSTLAVGVWAKSLLDKKEPTSVDWIAILIGFILVTLIGFVPFIGPLALFFLFLSGLGSIARYDLALFKRLRASKEL